MKKLQKKSKSTSIQTMYKDFLLSERSVKIFENFAITDPCNPWTVLPLFPFDQFALSG